MVQGQPWWAGRRQFSSAWRDANRELHGSTEARAIHAAHPAIDLHADTLMWSRWIGYDLGVRHEALLPRSAYFGHVDVPRLAEGGIGAQFFGLVSLPVAERGLGRAVDEQIDSLE